MKTSKIILTLCLTACLGHAFSAAVQADPDKQPALPTLATEDASKLPEHAKEPELPPPAQIPPQTAGPALPDVKAEELPNPPKGPELAPQAGDGSKPFTMHEAGLPQGIVQGVNVVQTPDGGQQKPAAAPSEEEPSDDAAPPPAQLPPQARAEPQAQIMSDPSAMPTYDISLFSHKLHVEGAGMDCASCHNAIFQQAAGAAKTAGGFNMKGFEQGKYCGACHDGGTAFGVKDQASCRRCHGSDMKPPEQPVIFVKPVEAVVFDHVRHNQEYGLACTDCHETLFKMKRGSSEEQADFTMKAMYDGKYCGGCHNGASAFAANTRCTVCHIGVKGNSHLSGGSKESGHGKAH